MNDSIKALKGLSLTLNQTDVIKIGNITLIYYLSDTGTKRLKVLAPKEIIVTREKREDFLKEKVIDKLD